MERGLQPHVSKRYLFFHKAASYPKSLPQDTFKEPMTLALTLIFTWPQHLNSRRPSAYHHYASAPWPAKVRQPTAAHLCPGHKHKQALSLFKPLGTFLIFCFCRAMLFHSASELQAGHTAVLLAGPGPSDAC